jgi:GT2 family glycosyltransferase
MASAANALAARAGGAPDDVLGFIHQDARLDFDAATVLPRYFDALPDAGVLGFCGTSRHEAGKQWHECRPRFGGLLQGDPPTRLTFDACPEGDEGLRWAEVETLDGYALFMRRSTFDAIGGFDERYDGWHGYDLDVCTRALAAGKRNYVIDQPSRHFSWGSSGASLQRALARHAATWADFFARRHAAASSRRLKIHVYTIAKNEAKFAERFAASCADADGVHVLDTGSDDDTVGILRRCGVHVEVETVSPWRFDVARNLSLALVPDDADVCLSIDLDEVLVPGWREIVERAWTPGTTHLTYRYAWQMRDGRPHVVFLYNKCHARHGYVWLTPVHEAITPVHGFVERVANAPDILVHHHPDPAKSRAQYLPLLELAVREDGQDWRSSYYLGREYTYVARWRDAIETLERYVASGAGWSLERASACQLIALSHQRLDQPEHALRWLLRAVAEEPNQRDPWVELADHLRLQGDHAGSAWAAGRALAIHESSGSHLNAPDNWGWRPHDLASLAAWQLGRRDEALAHAFAALEHAPGDERLVANARHVQQATAAPPPLAAGAIVDVVILAYSRSPDAYRMACDGIASLRASSPDVPARIVVVETHAGLRDEPYAEAALFGPDVEVVMPGGRFAYNRFVQAGLVRTADGPAPYAMILNNDVTLFAPGFLRAMLAGLQQVPSVSPLGYREAQWGLVDRTRALDVNYDVNRALCGWCVMFDRAILDVVPAGELFPASCLWYGQDEAYGEALRRHDLAHGLVTSARALHLQSRSHAWLGETLDAPADRADVHRTLGVRGKRCAVVGDEGEVIARELAAFQPASVVRADAGAAAVDDSSLDLVWLDGDGVALDAWWPKLRPGGWLFGACRDASGVAPIVEAFARERALRVAFVTRDTRAWAIQSVAPPSSS